MSNSSIWSIDRTLSSATTPGQSGPGSNGNEGILRILQSSSITEASPSDCLVSYPWHSLREGFTSLQRCSQYTLQPKPTELLSVLDRNTWNYATLWKLFVLHKNEVSKGSDLSRGRLEGSLFISYYRSVGKSATSFLGLLHFTLDPYLIILSVKQRGIKYHFLSLWYDSTWNWTRVSRAIGEHYRGLRDIY